MRRSFAAVVLATCSLLFVLLLQATGTLERLELLALDARYATGVGRTAPRDDIVIAWIDQESLDWLQEQDIAWPWPRSVYQEALQWLRDAGAKAVVFDILFDQHQFADEDREFGQALAAGRGDVLVDKFVSFRPGARTAAETARFRLRGMPPSGTLKRPPELGVTLPLPEFESGADQLGFANIQADADKTFRRYDVLRSWQPVDGAPLWYPSLALAAAMTAREASALRLTTDGLVLGDSPPVATDGAGRMLLNFRGPEFTFPRVKFANILQTINAADSGQAPVCKPEQFRDKIVLIGINAEGLEDAHATPLSRLFAGVELHATALDNLLTGDPLRAPAWELPLAIAAIGTTTATVFLVPGVGAAALAVAGLFAALFVWALLAWSALLAVPVAAPAVGGLTATGASFLWRLVVEGRQKRQMRRAFSSYMAPEVLAQVLRDPERLTLGGETREVTLFFTDLAGFTGLAEHIGPQALVAFLNDYFTRMCEPVLAQRGIVDKFIGDAIMAMFGAPLRNDDHALCAVRAALIAAAVSERIAGELAAAGKPAIETRIGIHTGAAVVGNMGSARRFDYTAIGDTVNLASRLEGANKAFGTRCLVSETAWNTAATAILGREVGLVAVKGREAPIRVFEPLAELATATASQRAFAAAWAHAIDLLRAGRLVDADTTFAALAEQRPDDALIARYRERLAEPGWNGVFKLDSK
ncbi:MAG: adenylate/guanylate cyclase domain-containing protein [Planctomycetes bacterium]|nr:adenylate/guanylate cyclase domain-containing protein [Planctomycetota bacterium]